MRYEYQTKSFEEYNALIELAKSYGHRPASALSDRYYNILVLDSAWAKNRENSTLHGNRGEKDDSCTITEFIDAMVSIGNSIGSQVYMPINDEYNAVYEKGESHVNVGCQRIPVDTIRELLKRIDKINA